MAIFKISILLGCCLVLTFGCNSPPGGSQAPVEVGKKIAAAKPQKKDTSKASPSGSSISKSVPRPESTGAKTTDVKQPTPPSASAQKSVTPAKPKKTAVPPKSVKKDPAPSPSAKAPQVVAKQKPAPPAPSKKRATTPKAAATKKPKASPAPDAAPTKTVIAAAPKPKPLVHPPKTKKHTPYNPAGKIDPFVPLYKDKPVVTKVKKVRRTPRTPLEKVDVSQLKLTGIIRAASGNKALVTEASGKGYVIKKGTYVGLHSGKVTEILKDRVIIEELAQNLVGELTVRKRELKLQRPAGE